MVVLLSAPVIVVIVAAVAVAAAAIVALAVVVVVVVMVILVVLGKHSQGVVLRVMLVDPLCPPGLHWCHCSRTESRLYTPKPE